MPMKFIFSIFILLVSTLSIADNRPSFVCGKFSDTVIEVPSNYVYSFAEYEGYSYFDPRFLENKKGCDANFRVLPLVMSWPEMKPFNKNENGKNKKLRFSIEPIDGDHKGYFEYKRYIYIERGEEKIKGDVSYDEKLNLYFNEVKLKKMNKYIDPENDKYGYYWRVSNDEISDFFDCLWIPLDGRYSQCDGSFLIPKLGIKVEVIIKIEDLVIWNEIKSDVVHFIYKHIKR
ncbi:hypothetical protein LDO51_12535 [Providencia alcalifaciens]|uniref:hypothetical protein n=1 Tax=Providencia alcalifaciens TaxID=126385 RepID=UPI001CE120A1|nr:hypothetical protein [Providencia alcalifaciens]UBX47988.1 hypothetical protein LDO51_12535 [Providencia alcalifaciens]